MSCVGASYRGVPASVGIVAGKAFHVGDRAEAADIRSLGREALVKAIEQAVLELEALRLKVAEEARDFLDFQIALLSDPELLRPLQDGGENPVQRWTKAFRAEITSLEGSGSDIFAARAVDYEDALLRVTGILHGNSIRATIVPEDHILVAQDLPPSAFLSLEWARNTGIALAGGSDGGHLAMLARAREIPMVCRLGPDILDLTDHLCLDGGAGTLSICGPSSVERAEFWRPRQEDPAMLRQAGIGIGLNINALGDFDAAHGLDYDEVGLVRTEFVAGGIGPRDVDLQSALYRRIINLAAGRPVTFRTFDFGGDKGGSASAGRRDLEAALDDEATFRAQCRALLKAAKGHGGARIMFPMVSSPAAFRQALDVVADEHRRVEGVSALPPLGMMVESLDGVAAMDACDADFFCVGSNDLAASIYGIARHAATEAVMREPGLNTLFQVLGTAVLTAAQKRRPIRICGEIAARPSHVQALLETGFRHFSVPPLSFTRVVAAIGALVGERPN
jgi:phosphotransferase system enzyme I (PtsI)